MNIGRIAYLNVFPFYHGLDYKKWGPWIEGTPKELGEKARRGEIDAAPLPVADTFTMEDDFEPLGSLGIASRGPVESVLFFSRRPLDELSQSKILLTGDSVTSVALLRILLSDAGNEEITYVTGDDPSGYDGYLVIGDRALKLDQQAPFEYRTDLGVAWQAQTGLPFVFARWVVRKTIADALKRNLATALEQALAKPLPPEIPNNAQLSHEAAVRYLNTIVYQLDDDCLQGLERFKERLYVHA